MAMIQTLIQRRLDRRLFKGPKAPDPVATANAQTASNVATAQKEAELNRYDQISPFGSTKWTQNGDKWTSTFELDPAIQGMLSQYQAAASQPTRPVTTEGLQYVGSGDTYRKDADSVMNLGTAQTGVNQAAGLTTNATGLANSQIDRLKQVYGEKFDFSKAPAMPTADEATRKAVEDVYYGRQTSRLDPQFQGFEQETRARLANQGLTEGSEAYNRELDQFMRGRNDAYATARNDATLNSTTELGKLFQMGLAARQQGVSEESYIRELATREAQAAAGLYGGFNEQLNSSLGTKGQLQQTAANIASQNANLDQNIRGNQLNEALLLNNQGTQNRQQLLNELIGLTSGSQIQGGGAGQVQVGASPVAQSIYNSYQGNAAASAAKNANITSGLGTAAGVAAMFAF